MDLFLQHRFVPPVLSVKDREIAFKCSIRGRWACRQRHWLLPWQCEGLFTEKTICVPAILPFDQGLDLPYKNWAVKLLSSHCAKQFSLPPIHRHFLELACAFHQVFSVVRYLPVPAWHVCWKWGLRFVIFGDFEEHYGSNRVNTSRDVQWWAVSFVRVSS